MSAEMLAVKNPLVSCLCTTYKRVAHLKLAITCFLQQNHANKELIVVHKVTDTETVQLLNTYNNPQIKPIAISSQSRLTLGELRNIAIEQASGKYLCTWDDDDWHSPDRINHQLTCIDSFKKPAVILTHILMYDKNTNAAYLSYSRLWENTLMVEKNALDEYKIRFKAIDRKEDYYFVRELISHNLIYPLLDPRLYIYQSTGTNTVGQAQLTWMHQQSQLLSHYQTLIIKKSLNEELTPLDAAAKMQSVNFMKDLCYIPDINMLDGFNVIKNL